MSVEIHFIMNLDTITPPFFHFKLSAVFCRKGIADLKRMMDYREVGGTPFLGITKPIIKAHGSSDALAICNAVRQAADAVRADLASSIEAHMHLMTIPKELEHAE